MFNKIPTLNYVSHPYLKSQAVWALFLSHTENEKKPEGGSATPPPPPRPLRVNFMAICDGQLCFFYFNINKIEYLINRTFKNNSELSEYKLKQIESIFVFKKTA